MNQGQATPVGQSAVSAGQSRPTPDPTASETTPQTGAPVAGATPVGETAHSAPPVQTDPEEAARQRVQNVGNLSMLARQAIAMQNETMTVNPKIIADFCTAYEQMAQGGTTEMPEGALEHAKEEGRREAIAEAAEEKATLLQRINELSQTHDEAPAPADAEAPVTESIPEVPGTVGGTGNEFKGPGQ